MENKNFVYVLGFVIVAALAVVAYLGIRSFTGSDTVDVASSTPSIPEEEQRIITAKHQFVAGVHTVAGEVVVPTPCELLEWQVATSTAAARIDFSTTSSGEVCAQVITSQRFKVSFRGEQTDSISATLNGSPVNLNLIPVGEGENLDDFEIFIKG